MIKCLLQNGGTCSETEIARVLLMGDRSQIEYYENITRNMVGRVLRNRNVVNKVGRVYQLVGFGKLSANEIDELVRLCEEKLGSYIAARGDKIWQHRRKSTGYISGTLRYEILKRAKFRCELCGISAEQRALEVDHIVPRNKGGPDTQENLQALCYVCNAMKRDRDDTDFRVYQSLYSTREEDCVFCRLDSSRIHAENQLALAIWDQYPVTLHHALIIPRRHISSYFELGRPEINACNQLLLQLQRDISARDGSAEAFNIGINDGPAAGQTISHCHIHLIPRRSGDIDNPIGGVRAVIPGKADYKSM